MKPAFILGSAIATFLLGACARSEDAAAVQSDDSGTAVEQVRPTAGDEQEPAVGEWRAGLQEERPALEFGSAGTAPLVSLVCGERGGLVLQRPGALAPGASPTVGISVGGQGRQVPVASGTGAAATQRASIPSGDTLIQQLSGAQGPIALRFGDGTPLILPPSPLIGQFAQSCESGGPQRGTIGAGADQANQAAEAGNAAAGGNETNAAGAR